MKPLFDVLTDLGASFAYLEAEHHLPVRVRGNRGRCGRIDLDVTQSTQYLSALLMLGPMLRDGLSIRITAGKVEGAYVRVTRHMLEQFGTKADLEGNEYRIPSGIAYRRKHYAIEPDMSAACYFYAAAALTSGEVTVRGVTRASAFSSPFAAPGDFPSAGRFNSLQPPSDTASSMPSRIGTRTAAFVTNADDPAILRI